MEEYLRSGNVQDALSSYREQKIPDRFVRYVLLAIMTQTLDKNGKVIISGETRAGSWRSVKECNEQGYNIHKHNVTVNSKVCGGSLMTLGLCEKVVMLEVSERVRQG